jgi:hypothetical protein
MQKLQDYPITTITNTKQSKRKDKFGTIKLFTSYKCTWIQPENQNYTMWMSTDKIFSHNKPNIVNHNLPLLKQFYLKQQQKHYSNIIEKKFHQPQSKDIRYVHEPLNLPLIQIHIHESNPNKDIKTTQPTIQLICDKAHIFTDIGNFSITIPKTRLEWLWKQYNINLGTQHHLDPLRPWTLEFAYEVIARCIRGAVRACQARRVPLLSDISFPPGFFLKLPAPPCPCGHPPATLAVPRDSLRLAVPLAEWGPP